MKTPKHFKPTRLELELLGALWKLGAGSIREIQESLPADRRLEYTTVQTIIYRLEEKGAVRRVKKIGNAHVFEAAITRESAQRRLVDDLLAFFGGRIQPVMAHLVETGRLSSADLKEIEKLVKARRDAARK